MKVLTSRTCTRKSPRLSLCLRGALKKSLKIAGHQATLLAREGNYPIFAVNSAARLRRTGERVPISIVLDKEISEAQYAGPEVARQSSAAAFWTDNLSWHMVSTRPHEALENA